MDDDFDARREIAVRWIKNRLEQVEPSGTEEELMADPSFQELYADYMAHVSASLRWRPWRLVQEFPAWMKWYRRKGADGKWRVYYRGVRIKAAEPI